MAAWVGEIEHHAPMTSRIFMPANPVSASERTLPVGTRLEEYEIESALAQSSTAVVYLAYDRVLKLRVAIKEYMPSALARRSADTQVVLRERAQAQSFEYGRQAFIDEARVLARCEHGALLRTLRILKHHGTVYRVMRYCPGQTLREHRRRMPGPPDEAALLACLDSLLGALAALHAAGWVHAAISPDSILMLAGGKPMLLASDAVRAALISDQTRSMMASIEPCFAPLEQCEPTPDNPVGPWTDLYSLATTLRFFISGQMPPSSLDVASERLFEPSSDLWQRLHGGRPMFARTRGWLEILDACLTEPAQDRPQSVAQCRDLLGRQGSARLQVMATALGPWTDAIPAALGPVGIEPATLDAAHGDAVACLQRTYPFIAAHAHETVAVAHASASQTTPSRASWRRHRRLWMGGATLLLVAAVASGGRMQTQDKLSMTGSSGFVESGRMESARSAAMPTPVEPPAHASTEANRLESTATPATADGSSYPALPSSLDTLPTTKPTMAPSDAQTLSNPRSLCGKRSGYALYQCMQSRCTNRQWTHHAQCRRLRQEQVLG
jgi:serine/threonine protein kinase